MNLGNILNMKDYLKNDCYCEGEIYDSSGFFYQLFKPEEECNKLGIVEKNNYMVVLCKDQLLILWLDKNQEKVLDTLRFDATKNNIKIMKDLIAGKEYKCQLDTFEKNHVEQDLKQIMSIADMIMVD